MEKVQQATNESDSHLTPNPGSFPMSVMQILRLLISKVRSMKALHIPVALFVACFALALGPAASAAQPGSSSATPGSSGTGKASKDEPTPKKARPLPFQGKIKTLDKAGGTFAIGERTFIVTAESKVMKRDKTSASLAALTVGEQVTGSYRKAEDGRLLINTLYIGPKENAETTMPPKTAPKKDSGKPK